MEGKSQGVRREAETKAHQLGEIEDRNLIILSLSGHQGLLGVELHETSRTGDQDAIGFGGLAGMMPSAIKATQFESNTGKRVMPVQIWDTPPETPDKNDPLRQRGTLGWRTTFVAKLLNEAFCAKIEHGVTA